MSRLNSAAALGLVTWFCLASVESAHGCLRIGSETSLGNTTAASSAVSKIIMQERSQSSWNKYYEAAATYLADHLGRENAIKIVEIGTAWGGNAAYMTNFFGSADIIAVDPLIPDYDSGDLQARRMHHIATKLGLRAEALSDAWAQALISDAQKRAGCRYHLLHMTSAQAAVVLKKEVNNIDYVFIDGVHTYKGVVDDIRAFYPLVRSGGVLVFNDYGGGVFPGVTKAVDEFIAANNLRLVVGSPTTPPGSGNAGVLKP